MICSFSEYWYGLISSYSLLLFILTHSRSSGTLDTTRWPFFYLCTFVAAFPCFTLACYSSNEILTKWCIVLVLHLMMQNKDSLKNSIWLMHMSYLVETMDNQSECIMVSTMVHLTHSFSNVGKWCFTALTPHGNSRSANVMSHVASYQGSSPCLGTRLVTCSYNSI